jgi:hypothetical protein
MAVPIYALDDDVGKLVRGHVSHLLAAFCL